MSNLNKADKANSVDRADRTNQPLQETSMTPQQRVEEIDGLLSHVWMVRTFLKHSEEAEEDEELDSVYRALYDYMLALGAPYQSGDWDKYLRVARKKLGKLRRATELFLEIQPEISSHTNFQMAARSLKRSVDQIAQLLQARESAS